MIWIWIVLAVFTTVMLLWYAIQLLVTDILSLVNELKGKSKNE